MDTTPVRNLLLEEVEYKVEETSFGVWRRFLHPQFGLFEEFTSHGRLFGLPLFHYTRGRSPETGKRKVAKGVVAVGRLAVGGLAVGHVSAGLVAIGQLGLGLLFGLGQGATGALAVGQVAVALGFALGQVAVGYAAVGQLAVGWYALGQFGVGEYVWDISDRSPAAVEFFRSWASRFGLLPLPAERPPSPPGR